MAGKSVDENSRLLTMLLWILSFIPYSSAALGDYLPLYTDLKETDGLITSYFHLGFSYTQIIAFLALYHGFKIGYRHFQRKLREIGLKRYSEQSPPDVLIAAAQTELDGTGKHLGYRSMYQRIRQKHKLRASRESVRIILRQLDPQGVKRRQQRRLRRREYYASGPNFLWHIDGWDKLKQFGLCIHGCIDGYSRRVMWLEVSSTNNDPKVVCRYFSKCIKQIKGLPHTIRADRGTENVNVEMMQTVLSNINVGATRSSSVAFLYGKSTANQRIEAWWSKFGLLGIGVWIDHLKSLERVGIIDTSRELDIQCVMFCYIRLLQKELKSIAQLWNTHYIRKSQNTGQPNGRPDVMYHLPELFGGIDGLQPLSERDSDILSNELTRDIPYCKDHYRELFCLLMDESDKRLPTNLEEAQYLLVYLLDTIDGELDQ